MPKRTKRNRKYLYKGKKGKSKRQYGGENRDNNNNNNNNNISAQQTAVARANEGDDTLFGLLGKLATKSFETTKNTIGSTSESVAETADELFKTATKPFENPAFLADADRALKTASASAELALHALDKPLDEAIEKLNESGEKALSGVATGAVKAGTDAVAAIPGVGTLVELPKIADDLSKSVGQVAKATNEATETVSNLVNETKENIAEEQAKISDQLAEAGKNATGSMSELANENNKNFANEAAKANEKINNLQKEAENVGKRTADSVANFANTSSIPSNLNNAFKPVPPLPSVPPLPKGGSKPVKPILKKDKAATKKGTHYHNSKTKRVRFSN
jgi:hypothetical protein